MSASRNANRINHFLSRLSVASAVALTSAGVIAAPSIVNSATTSAAAIAATATAISDNKTPDKIVLKDGTVVLGAIVSETDTHISINQVFRVGSIEQIVLRSYAKADINTIERGVNKPDNGNNNNQPQGRPGSSPASNAGSSTRAAQPSSSVPSVYFVTLTGEFGLDMNYTPIKRIIDDARQHQPDYLIIKIDADFAFYGQEREAWQFDINGFFGKYDLVKQIQLLFLEEIPRDPQWEKKPKVVTWVNNAMGGATLLPFVSDTMYFTSRGMLGGAGPADMLYATHADELVRQKWLDMIVTPMEGTLLRNGYPFQLAKAFAYMQYVLSYKLVGGQPVFFEGFPENAPEEGYILLVDDGDLNAGRRDALEDVIRLRINDWLVMDASLAQRLGVSKGTADTLDDLMFQLGVVGEFHQIENARGDRIISTWRDEVTRAERNLGRLVREFAQIEVQGDYTERQRARGQQINTLRQIQAIFRRYGESINPAQFGTAIDWDVDIEIQISRIRTAMRLDQRD